MSCSSQGRRNTRRAMPSMTSSGERGDPAHPPAMEKERTAGELKLAAGPRSVALIGYGACVHTCLYMLLLHADGKVDPGTHGPAKNGDSQRD
ncbi:unnamed protein product [Urochloa humidicola]